MALIQVPYVGAAYEAKSLNLSAQRCINLYPVANETGGAKVRALYPTPGLKRWRSFDTSSPVRGIFPTQDALIAIVGATIYLIKSDKSAVQIGIMNTVDARIVFATNGNQVLFVDGVDGYLYEKEATTSHEGDGTETHFTIRGLDTRTAPSIAVTINGVPDAGFTVSGDEIIFSVAPANNDLIVARVNDALTIPTLPATPTHVDCIAGYFVVNNSGTGQFYLSGLRDGSDWDVLDFANAEASPDDVLALVTGYQELWLIGERTTEVWSHTGDATFPFRRMSGAVIDYGIGAPYSLVQAGNTLFWLTDKLQVVCVNGYQPQRISTLAIESALSEYNRTDDAFAYSYSEAGHTFYVLTFPAAGKTWCFDATTNLWHERAYWRQDVAKFSRHRSNCYGNAFGKHLVGDYQGGVIFEMDKDTFTDDEDLIRRVRSTDHAHIQMQRVTIDSLHVDMEVGSAIQLDGYGSEPQAMLRYSKDGGHTWSGENWATIGRVGNYGHRVIWRRLGQSRQRVFEITITDPIWFTIMDAVAEVSE